MQPFKHGHLPVFPVRLIEFDYHPTIREKRTNALVSFSYHTGTGVFADWFIVGRNSPSYGQFSRQPEHVDSISKQKRDIGYASAHGLAVVATSARDHRHAQQCIFLKEYKKHQSHMIGTLKQVLPLYSRMRVNDGERALMIRASDSIHYYAIESVEKVVSDGFHVVVGGSTRFAHGELPAFVVDFENTDPVTSYLHTLINQ